MGLKQIWKQPLVHFLAIGALLFGTYYAIRPPAKQDIILVDDGQIDRMIMVFKKEWNRVPTESELKGLLERYIEQEIYYRKALEMNLDKNDEFIRRRLEQKLRFLTHDMANQDTPRTADLLAFYGRNKEKYLEPAKYSFNHLYFNPDQRADAKSDASLALLSLIKGDPRTDKKVGRGDQFPFDNHIVALSKKEIGNMMGDSFCESLDSLPLEKWSGPILSGYGSHLIFITAFIKPFESDFAEIRDKVMLDYQYELQNEYNSRLFKEFRNDFNIVVNIDSPRHNRELIQKLVLIDGN